MCKGINPFLLNANITPGYLVVFSLSKLKVNPHPLIHAPSLGGGEERENKGSPRKDTSAPLVFPLDQSQEFSQKHQQETCLVWYFTNLSAGEFFRQKILSLCYSQVHLAAWAFPLSPTCRDVCRFNPDDSLTRR
jgi:hypothetical protein